MNSGQGWPGQDRSEDPAKEEVPGTPLVTKGRIPEGHTGQGRSRDVVDTWERNGGKGNKDKMADPLESWAGDRAEPPERIRRFTSP